jgi:hypothetical protein
MRARRMAPELDRLLVPRARLHEPKSAREGPSCDLNEKYKCSTTHEE